MKQRQEKIIEILKEKKYISISNLVSTLHYSESTIRRDLVELEKLHIVKRTPGGVVLIKEEFVENPLALKIEINKDEKRMISELAIDLVEDYQTVFLDSSSTSRIFADKLNTKKNLTVVTSNIHTAIHLEKSNDTLVYSVGGRIIDGKVGGAYSDSMLKNFYADIAFISCRGIDLINGISDKLETEASLKRIFNLHAEKTALLVDNSKFDRKFTYFSLPISNVDYIITDKLPDNRYLDLFERENIELLYWND